MSQRRPAVTTERPTFDDVADEIGEDPARFLLAGDELLAARIKGIDRVDVARKWIEVELELAEEQGRTPRKDVIGALNARIKHLEEHGDREEQLKHKRGVRPESDKTVTFVDDEGNHYTPEEWDRKRGDPIKRRREPDDPDVDVDEDQGGKPASHPEPDEPDDSGEAAPEEGGKTVNQASQNDSDDRQVEPDDLSGHTRAIYLHLDRKGPALLAGVQGAMARRGLDLEAAEGLVDYLVDVGLVDELEDGRLEAV